MSLVWTFLEASVNSAAFTGVQQERMSLSSSGAYVLLHVVSAWCFLEGSGAQTRSPHAFYAIARRVETDKVTEHHYETLYNKYLQPIADKRLRLLEGEELLLPLNFVFLRNNGASLKTVPSPMQWAWAATWLTDRAIL